MSTFLSHKMRSPSLPHFASRLARPAALGWYPRSLSSPLLWLQNNSRRTLSRTAPLFCAQERTRTSKPLRALPPQGSTSTNFATWASGTL